jgi:hypothetical protein
MRKFNLISPKLWTSHTFRTLSSDDARLLHLYLLTNAHTNSAGCYALRDAYGAADLDWPLEKYRTIRDQVSDAQLILCDNNTEEIFIDGWFQHNAPANPKHLQAVVGYIENIRSDLVRETALEALAAVCPVFQHNRTVSAAKRLAVPPQQPAAHRLLETNHLKRST